MAPVPTSDAAAPAASGLPGRLRHSIFIVVPLAVILGVAAIASYFYLEHRQRYFTERYVRALAALAEQSEGAIDGLDSALEGAVGEWEKFAVQLDVAVKRRDKLAAGEMSAVAATSGSKRHNRTSGASTGDMCCAVDPRLSQADGTVCAPEPLSTNVCSLNNFLNPQLDLVPLRLSSTLPREFRIAPSDQTPGVLARSNLLRNQQTRSSTRRVLTTAEQPPVDTADATLYFCRTIPDTVHRRGKDASCGPPSDGDWVCAEKLLSELLDPLIKGSALDSLALFVVDNDGITLYERGNTGLRLAAIQKLTEPTARQSSDGVKGPPVGLPTLEEVISTTGVRPLEVGGLSYMLFSQPLRLKSRGGDQYTTWAIGTLVPLSALQSDARRMPLAVIGGVPLACLLALLALPILKVLTMGPRESLAATTVCGVAVAVLLATALATLASLAWYAHGQLGQRVDDELRLFSRRLQLSFRAELRTAYTVLESFRDRRLAQHDGAMPQTGYVMCDHILDGETGSCRSTHGEPPRPDAFFDLFDDYPAFDMLVLADRNGMQREKWTIENINTPVIDVKGFNAFQDVMRGRMLTMPKTDAAAGAAGLYALNVITSPNTGKLVTLLSVPIPDKQARAARGRGANWSHPDGVAMMVPHLLSVDDPVTPPDVGFAVIESSGRVVFHSKSRRRLYENFFAEATGDLGLRSALYASRAGLFDIEYHGDSKRLFVSPLRETPWSLLVFRDTDPLQTANVEAVTTALGCFLAVVVLYAVWLGLARAALGGDLSAAVWPDPRARARYWTLACALLALAAWFAWTSASRDGVALVLIAVTTPLLALTMVIVGLALGHTSVRRWLVGLGVLATLAAIDMLVSVTLHGPRGAVPWILIGLLLAATVVSWEPSWLPRPTHGRLVAPYVTLAFALLINVSVLPTAILFRDAFGLSAEALGRTRQLTLTELIAGHRQALWQRVRNVSGGRLLVDFRRSFGWDESGLIAYRQAAPRPAAPDRSGRREAGAGQTTLDGTLPSQTAAHRGSQRLDEFPVASALTTLIRDAFPAFCRDGDGVRDLPCAVAPGGRVIAGDLLAQSCGLYKRHFTAAVMSRLPVFNADALELRHAVYPHASDCAWWTGLGDRLVTRPRFGGQEREKRASADGRNSSRRIPSLRPWVVPLAWPSSPSAWIVFPLVAAAALTGLWCGLSGLVRRIFCLDVWELRGADDARSAPAAGTFNLRPPAARVELLRQRAKRQGGEVIDLAILSQPGEVADRISELPTGPILLDHFERGVDDEAWNKQKLTALEEIVLRRRQPVDIVSDVDILGDVARRSPAAATDQPAPSIPAEDLPRWANVLACLDKRADLPSPPLPPGDGEEQTLRDECEWTPRLRSIGAAIRADKRWTALSPPALVRHVGDLAEAYYRSIWSSLDDKERLVLYHLSRDGFVNALSCDLARRLMRRGLIRRAPALRVMNESFRQFVRGAEDHATIRTWERAGGASVWGWLRNGVMVVAVVGGVFLFLTQPDAYAKWVALLAALTTVGGGVTQLLGLFQGNRRSATAG